MEDRGWAEDKYADITHYRTGTVHSVQCIVYSAWCTVHSEWTVHGVQYIVSGQCMVAQYIVDST